MQRKAIIDLGTNTFNLLVFEIDDHGWHAVHRSRVFVNLAVGGINIISTAAEKRALQALGTFATTLARYDVNETKVVGTAAIRTAANSGDLIDAIYDRYSFRVEVISGMQEASWIAKGVLQSVPDRLADLLILDIGGGSVECIISHQGQTQFSQSYPVGVAVLYEKFHHQEPMDPASLRDIDRCLETELDNVYTMLRKFPQCTLAGASGTFEVLARMGIGELPPLGQVIGIAVSDFRNIYEEIIGLSYEERLAHPDIPTERARYVVVALHLIHHLLNYLQTPVVLVSQYAMREGLASEMAKS